MESRPFSTLVILQQDLYPGRRGIRNFQSVVIIPFSSWEMGKGPGPILFGPNQAIPCHPSYVFCPLPAGEKEAVAFTRKAVYNRLKM